MNDESKNAVPLRGTLRILRGKDTGFDDARLYANTINIITTKTSACVIECNKLLLIA